MLLQPRNWSLSLPSTSPSVPSELFALQVSAEQQRSDSRRDAHEDTSHSEEEETQTMTKAKMYPTCTQETLVNPHGRGG